MTRSPWMTAPEVAAELGVKVATVYAYVSRGLLRSQPGPGPRERVYPREDVERLRSRTELQRAPARAARRTLSWGTPVLDSELTLIADGTFCYRGFDAIELGRSRRFEEVCGLLWTGRLAAPPGLEAPVEPLPAAVREALAPLSEAHCGDAFHVALRLLAPRDAGAADLRPERVAERGAWIIHALAVAAGGVSRVVRRGVAAAFQRGLTPHRPEAERVIGRALVLCADHELNVSSFTARCVASAGATPWDVVTAGMAALRGHRHGGASDRATALLADLGVPALAERRASRRSPPSVERTLEEWLRRGEPIPGFGHRLYPGGDPRWASLREAIAETWPGTLATERLLEVAERGTELVGEPPNLDLALGGLARLLDLRSGGAWAIFALGRTAGWIAHALEEYRRGELIRPRARYVGPVPGRAPEAEP